MFLPMAGDDAKEFAPHPLRPYRPLVIYLAPTGLIPTREKAPFVPLTPREIGEDVELCAKEGATAVHVHPRDEQGHPTQDPKVFAAIIQEIRSRVPDIVICATTSGRAGPELEMRMSALNLEGDLKPDLASLTLGSVNFPTAAAINLPETIEALALRMRERGIKPECE